MIVNAEITSQLISVSAVFPGMITVTSGLSEQVIPVEADINSMLTCAAIFSDPTIDVDCEIINRLTTSTAEEYDGAYEVTSFLAAPSLTSSLVLPTRQKIMRNNMTFYSVPTTEEYNEQGGVTFTIGD